MSPGGARCEGWTSGEEILSILDVMSSTRLLMYFGAIYGGGQRNEPHRRWSDTDRRSTTLEVVDILIEGVTVQLNRNNFFYCRIRYAQ